MKKSFGNYRFLAKGGSRFGGSLWEGPDHLLEIETTGVFMAISESYRRIDYRNIQSITYARTRRGLWTTIVYLLLLALLGLAIWGNSRDTPVVAGLFAILAGIVIVAVALHLARGPTCVCKLQTAVQVRKLKPLDRLRKAERFVRRMSDLCMAHQAGLQTAAASMGEATPSAGAMGIPQATALPNHIKFKPPWTGSKLVTAALISLIVSGSVTIADIFIKGLPFFGLDFILGITAYVLAISALTRSVKYELPGALATALKGAAVTFVLGIATGYGLIMTSSFAITKTMMVQGARPSLATQDGLAIYRYLADAGFEELGWAAWWVIILGAAAVFLGLLGLPAALRPGAKAATTAPPPLPGTQPPTPTMESPP